MGEKMTLRECDNPSGEWCKGCRSAGMSHCSDPVHCGQMQPMAHHVNCSHCRPDTGNAEADRLIGRLMSSDPGFDDCTDAAVFIRRLARAHLTQPAQAVDRAERAEALLRECVAAHTGENIEGCDMSDADVARITAHLSENSRG